MKSKVAPAWLSIAALLIIWQIAASRVDNPALFPSLVELLKTSASLLGSLSFYETFLATLFRALNGFLLATFLALPASIAALNSPFWKSFLQPFIVVLRSIPVIAVVLIALLYLSLGRLPVIIGCITMLPILYQSFLSAWEHTDPKLIHMARLYQKSIMQRFHYIYMLQSKELLFAGIATATGFGWRAIIIGEVLSSPGIGIGTAMKKSQAYIDMPGLLAWTMVAIGGGFLIDWLWKKMAALDYIPTLKTNDSSLTEITAEINTPEIKLSSVSFSFEGKQLFNNLNLKLTSEHIYLLTSISGSGKTTLLKLIAGILHPDTGTIDSSDINRIAFSFQDQRLIPQFTVEHNIAFALKNFPSLTHQQQEKLDNLLIQSGLNELRDKLPGELSGGEQQRVNFMRALILQADLLLLDEPLTGLDAALKTKLMELLTTELSNKKSLVVWATHENTDALKLSTLELNKL